MVDQPGPESLSVTRSESRSDSERISLSDSRTSIRPSPRQKSKSRAVLEVLRAIHPADLARHLNLQRPAVYRWVRVPEQHVIEVERLTGIPRTRLRPDLHGPDATPRRPETPLDEAIKAYGSASGLARALGLDPSSCANWTSGVPPKWVLRVEELTGISRTRLRPDLYPPDDFAEVSRAERAHNTDQAHHEPAQQVA